MPAEICDITEEGNIVVNPYHITFLPKEDVYELTMKPSFGRINNKKLILELEKHLNLDFNIQTSYKFAAKWNTGLKMLIVDTKEVAKDV